MQVLPIEQLAKKRAGLGIIEEEEYGSPVLEGHDEVEGGGGAVIDGVGSAYFHDWVCSGSAFLIASNRSWLFGWVYLWVVWMEVWPSSIWTMRVLDFFSIRVAKVWRSIWGVTVRFMAAWPADLIMRWTVLVVSC